MTTQYTDRSISIANARTRQAKTARHLRNIALARFFLASKTAPAKADHLTIYTLAIFLTAIAWAVLQ